jgi:hypothetical protein
MGMKEFMEVPTVVTQLDDDSDPSRKRSNVTP